MSLILRRMAVRVSRSLAARNAIKMVSGTVGSQLILLFIAPILTRLYSPSDFGMLASFAAVLSLAAVATCLRYELAIPLPESDEDAAELYWLCITIACLTSLVVAIVCILLCVIGHTPFGKSTAYSFLSVLPLGVLLVGIYQPTYFWAVRHKRFGLLAGAKVSSNVLASSVNVFLFPLGVLALFIGQIISQAGGIAAMGAAFWTSLLRGMPSTVSPLIRVLRAHREFGIYSMLSGIINACGNQIPMLIFAGAFGPSLLGQLWLAQRLLVSPANLLAQSIQPVFFGLAKERLGLGQLRRTVMRTLGRLVLAGAVYSSIALLVAPAVPLIFGERWRTVIEIIPAVIPLIFGSLIAKPLGMAFFVLRGNRLELIAQAGLAVLRLGPLVMSVFFDLSFVVCINVYSYASLLGYCVYVGMLFEAIRMESRSTITFSDRSDGKYEERS